MAVEMQNSKDPGQFLLKSENLSLHILDLVRVPRFGDVLARLKCNDRMGIESHGCQGGYS